MKAELYKKIEEYFNKYQKLTKENYELTCKKFGENNVSEYIEDVCEGAEDKVVEQTLEKYAYYYDKVKKDTEETQEYEYEKDCTCNDIMHDILAQLKYYPLLTVEEERHYAQILNKTRRDLVIETCNNTKTSIEYETIFASIKKPEQLSLIKDLLKYNVHTTLKPDETAIFKKYLKLTDNLTRILTIEDLKKEFGFKFEDNSYKVLSENELKNQINMLIERRHTKAIMTESNLRLIIHITKRYSSVRTMSKEDMYMEGCLGLDRALERYDASKGYRFSTYATWWIRQGITRAIADQARTMRIPVHMLERYIKYNKMKKELLDILQREPTPLELEEYTGFNLEQLSQLDKISVEFISLETPINDDGDSSLADFVPADQKSVEDQVAAEILPIVLGKIMDDHLTPKEKAVLTLRYGLEGGNFRTLESVGNEFDVTRERIRQIEGKALRKLRRHQILTQLNEFRH